MKIKSKILIWSVPVTITGVIVWAVVVIGLQIRQRELDHALIVSINKHDAARVISLLDSGANANATNKPYSKPTIQKILSDLWMKVRGIKPLPNTYVYSLAIMHVYPQESTPYVYTRRRQHLEEYVEILDALLKHGANIETNWEYGETVLSKAVENDDLPAVKYLLQHNANPNITSYDGGTPLGYAHVECAKLLIKYHADVNGGGIHPLSLALFEKEDVKVKLLLESGANPNLEDWRRQPQLHWMLAHEWFRENKSESKAMIGLLLKHGALVSKKNTWHRNALDIAINNKDHDAIPILRTALKKEEAAKSSQP